MSMMSMMSMMNIPKKYLVGGIIAISILVSILFLRACDIEDGYSRLQGEYNVLRADMEMRAKEYAEIRDGLEHQIGDLTKKIGDLLANRGKPTEAEKVKDKTIAALQADLEKWKKLGDCPKALGAAERAIVQWSEKFTLAEDRHLKTITELNGVWEQKFNTQVKITVSYKSELESALRVIDAGEGVNAALKWDLRKARLVGTVKSGLIVAAGGYLIYNLLKGK